MMAIEDQQLKAFIEDANLVKEKDLEAAYKEAKKTKKELGRVLIDKELVTPEKIAQVRAYILGIPFVDLLKEKIDPEILKIIPEPIARKHSIIAYNKRGNRLEVAMLDPEDLQTIDFIRKKAGVKISARLTTKESIQALLGQYEETLQAEFQNLIEQDVQDLTVEKKGKDSTDKKDLKKQAEELPIIRIVDSVLRHAITQRASDIHIEPEERDVVVRYRIDGILHDTMTLPQQVSDGIVARIKVLSNLRLDEHRLPQDGRFTIKTSDSRVSFRVSILPVFDGEKIVMRLLRENSKGFTLEELGFRDEALERIQRAMRRTTGMLLATGPTGSGKTTTLYTILDILNTPEVNIATIEDPVEYRMPRINQTQVRPDIGLTFSNGLRSLVRQDPDIIMVGEIRDTETASLAINAALTGHFVISTLHTNSAAGAMPRLIDMGQETFLIASTLNVIIAQRLVRRLCSDTPPNTYHLSKKELEALEEQVDLKRALDLMKKAKVVEKNATWEDIDFSKPVASEDCPDGYKGRFGIYEVLEVTETIKHLIINNAISGQIHDQAKKEGMVTMFEDGLMKAAQGITTIEEILRVTSD